MKGTLRFEPYAARNLLLTLVHAACVAGAASAPLAMAQPVAATPGTEAPEFRLQGDRVTLPFVIVRAYPFVEGSVEDVPGKLMLDTGIRRALAVNDHRVPVAAVAAGSGQFGSGQKFATRRAPLVKEVRLPGLSYPQVSEVSTQDATQLERITADFIGWIGYEFWADYALKLDYRLSEATFYRGASDAYLVGERLCVAVPFVTRKQPQIPVAAARIGDIDAIASFDTGAYGELFIDEQNKAKLIASGVLTPAADGKFDLSQLTLGGVVVSGMKGIDVTSTPFPAAEPTGLHDKIMLVTGYAFLSNYKSVWDYRSKTLYLLYK